MKVYRQNNLIFRLLCTLLDWVGNEVLHLLTSSGTYMLRIDLEDFDGHKRYAEYSDFTVGSESESYKLLSLGTYTGNAGKTDLDFTGARDSEWQWHQLGHMQVCISLQTNNHASTHRSVFYRPDALPAAQPTASKH